MLLEPARLPNSYSLFPEWRDLAASLLADGVFFSSLVGHTFSRHTLPLSKLCIQAPVSHHKECPSLWRTHLRREASCSQTTHSKDIPGTFLCSGGSVASSHKQYVLPLHWHPIRNCPLGSCCTQGRVQGGANSLSGVLLLDQMPVGQNQVLECRTLGVHPF